MGIKSNFSKSVGYKSSLGWNNYGVWWEAQHGVMQDF